MKQITAQKRFEKINANQSVKDVIEALIKGENYKNAISDSVYKNQPNIEAYSVNQLFNLYKDLVSALVEIGFKLKIIKTDKSFDITIKNIEYQL